MPPAPASASSSTGADGTETKSRSSTSGTLSSTKGKDKDKDTTQTKKKKVRRKKLATTSKSTSSSSQAVHANARQAQAELTAQRTLEAAMRKDPLWYRTNEVLSAISADAVASPGLLSEQVELVESALQKNHLGRADVTPQAFAVLLEQSRRYALELIADAQDYAFAANRSEIAKADLLLATELRPRPPGHHMLAELQQRMVMAHNVNKLPLPPIPANCYGGIVLPPKQHQLTARTYDIVTGARVKQKMTQSMPVPTEKTSGKSSGGSGSGSTSRSSRKSSTGAYGATKGRQIAIHMKGSSSTTKGSDSTKGSASTGVAAAAMAAAVQQRPGSTGTTSGSSKRKADEML